MKKALGILASAIDIKINLREPAHRLIDEVLEPALDKAVKESKTQIDDMAKAALYPTLEAKIKELIDDKLKPIEDDIKAKIDAIKALAN